MPTSLGDRIPAAGLPDDAVIEAVFAWVADRGLELYPAQDDAILELLDDAHVILATPTGSGKSLVAVALHALHLGRGERSIYTAPIKALVAEKFFALCEIFGADRVGMMTGDGAVNRDAPILCCTAEVLAKIALRHGDATGFAGVVMDEFHFYGDRDRGMAWQVPLITMQSARFLLMSATLGPTTAVERNLTDFTGRPVRVVRSAQRPVPLEFRYATRPLLSTLDDLLRAGKAPIYAVHFSQRAATELAGNLLSTDFSSKERKAEIKAEVKGFRFDSPFGKHLRRMVLHGVGLHHAGLLPKYRLLVEKLAQKGLFGIICGTDTLGVGINVPIRTVLFSQLCKFDGASVDILTVRDFRQIAGRAGRKGFDDEGLVVAQAPAWVIENQINAAKDAGKKKKKRKKAQAPTRGYKHWTKETFERLQTGQPERLEARFTLDHSVALARIRRANDLGTDALDELDALIERAHAGQRRSEALREQARQRIDELVSAGVVEPVGSGWEVYDDLQDDFGLYHALSLFLLHLIDLLRPTRDTPDYALDVVSCVEAVLEHPKVVLYAQVSRAKTERMAELKAAGVPYEERIEALEDVTWPKPKARWIYDTFEEWRTKRPWVEGDPVRPKAVVRELVETRAVFSTWVKTLGIDRSEGVLLRYVSQVYKTLVQGVPAEARTPELVDVIGFLRAMLARVDDSLVTEWEAMRSPEAQAASPAPIDISADLPTFRARIRAELHALVRALAVQDYDEAAATVRQVDGHERDARDFESDLAGFLDEWGAVAWDGRTRQAWNTVIREDGDHRWLVSQRLLAADIDVDPDDVDWFVEGVVDLSDDRNPSGPLVQILSIGS